MNCLGMMISALWGVSIFLIVYGIGQVISKKLLIREKFRWQEKRQPANNTYYRLLKYRKIYSLKKKIEDWADFSGVYWSFTRYLIYTLLSYTIGAAGAIFYMNNIPAAIPLGIAVALIPLGYLNHLVTQKHRLLEKQFMPAVQLFITEYGTIKNITSVLNRIEGRLDFPMQEELARLGRELNSGNPPDQTLQKFAQRLKNPWGYKFAHILNLRYSKGVEITPLLFKLLMEMKTKVIQEKQRSMEMTGVRIENYLLYLSVPVMYVFASRVNPRSHYLLTQTASGKKTMLIMLIILLAGIAGTLWVNNNKVR